jgi:outer membrane cobalamin receptor
MVDRSPRHAPRAALSLVLLAMTILGASAQEDVELDPVAVTASRISESESDSPPAMSVVTRSDMAARGVTTLAQALSVVPGLSLSDKGPEGSQVSITIRGSTTNQVLVLVDGVRANDALTGLVDLSLIPLDSVERIEIRRGGGSSLYGGDAVGGVVNIITKKAAAPLELSFENSSYLPAKRVVGFGTQKVEEGPSAASLVDAQRASVSWAPSLGGAALRFAGSATRAENAFTFIDDNGEDRELQNAALLGADASMGAIVPVGSGSLSADLFGDYSSKGVPGPESSPTPQASETDTSAKAVARYSSERFLSDLFSLDASAQLDYAGIDYADPEDPSSDGNHRLLTGQAEATQRAYLSDGLTLVYGLSQSYAAASSDTLGSPHRLALGAFFESALALGPLSLRPSLRYDYYSDFSGGNPLGPIGVAIDASYRVSRTDSLKLSLTRAYRVPTFEDLYWPDQDGAEGNPSLRPETSYEADLGYERLRGSLRFTATGYLRYAQDVILWQPGSDGTWRPSNFGAALYPGIELELADRISESCSVSANYTYLPSYVLSGGLGLDDDKRLPMTPVHSLKGTLSCKAGRLSWSATGEYASLRYTELANVAYLPAYFTLDLFLRARLSERLSLYAAGDNLLDEQYQLIEDYPMPGTRIRLGAEMRL